MECLCTMEQQQLFITKGKNMKKTILSLIVLLSVLFLVSCIETIVPDDVTGIDLDFEPEEVYVVDSAGYSLSGKEVTVHFSNRASEGFQATDERIQITGDVTGSGQSLALDISTVGPKTASFSYGGVSVTVAFYVADLIIGKDDLQAQDTVSTLINSVAGDSLENPKHIYIETGVYEGAELGNGASTSGAVNEVLITTDNVVVTTSSINPATIMNLEYTFNTVFDVRGTGVTIENFIVIRHSGLTDGAQAIAVRNKDVTLQNMTIRGGDAVAQKTNSGITVLQGNPGVSSEGAYNTEVTGIKVLNNIITGFTTSINVSAYQSLGTGVVSDVLIEGNTLLDAEYSGIQIVYWNIFHDLNTFNFVPPITGLVIRNNSVLEDVEDPFPFVEQQIFHLPLEDYVNPEELEYPDLDLDWNSLIANNTFGFEFSIEDVASDTYDLGEEWGPSWTGILQLWERSE
jgi:hypothetical protein